MSRQPMDALCALRTETKIEKEEEVAELVAAWAADRFTDDASAQLLRMKVKLPGAFGLLVGRWAVGAG
jgi:hypothetical protein